MSTPGHGRPLDGIRVLEMGQLIAGPFAGCILGYFGAQVIKIEPPVRGDALRNWRVLKNGHLSVVAVHGAQQEMHYPGSA